MAKSYSVELVGEANFQQAIAALRENEDVQLVPEPDNPYDPRAISVRDGDGDTVGYIPRNHWLTGALLDEGKVADASVKAVHGGTEDAPSLGVVLSVTLGAPVARSPEPNGIIAKASAAAVSAAEREARSQRMRAALGPSSDDEARAKPKKKNSNARDVGVGCLGLLGLLFLASLFAGDDKSSGSAKVSEASAAAATDAQRAGVKRWHGEMMSAVRPCDIASMAMAEQMEAVGSGSGSMLGGYRAAQVAKDRCLDSFSLVGDVRSPDGPWEDKADEAQDTCEMAMSTRRSAADSAMTVFDGDLSASAMSELQDDVQSGAQFLQMCAIQVIGVAADAGFELGEDGALVQPETDTEASTE